MYWSLIEAQDECHGLSIFKTAKFRVALGFITLGEKDAEVTLAVNLASVQSLVLLLSKKLL